MVEASLEAIEARCRFTFGGSFVLRYQSLCLQANACTLVDLQANSQKT